MVSAWGCEQRRVLGQIAAGAKSNEITSVPKLLEMLSLKGCVVTVDALDRQRGTARKIVYQGGGDAGARWQRRHAGRRCQPDGSRPQAAKAGARKRSP
jgi:hypothetical protein